MSHVTGTQHAYDPVPLESRDPMSPPVDGDEAVARPPQDRQARQIPRKRVGSSNVHNITEVEPPQIYEEKTSGLNLQDKKTYSNPNTKRLEVSSDD